MVSLYEAMTLMITFSSLIVSVIAIVISYDRIAALHAV
ncbi:putative holin-like toxin [Bacillus massilinigeriensis]|nr:putative holin-like toxin [Bacillus mediterraneensis]